MKPIRTLLVEDHTIVREGLRTLLGVGGRIEVIAEARNGREAVELTNALQPDVVVMDIAMPKLNGLQAAREILAASPRTKVLILSAYGDEDYIDGVIAAGAVGFLVKQTTIHLLDKAIHAVMEGKMFFSPQVERRVLNDYRRPDKLGMLTLKSGSRLTPREIEVIRQIAEGRTNQHIAVAMRISIKTVEKHRQHLMDKLTIHDIAGLTRYAIAHRLVDCNTQGTRN